MKKLRAIITDDEPLALDLMASILDQIPEIEIVARCHNGRTAIEQVQTLQPDLLFLDIQMPGTSGFDVVKALQADVMPMVVFATAYDKYALGAFDLHAVDYVLKPFDPDRIKLAVQRAAHRHQADQLGDRKKPLMGAIGDLSQRSEPTAESDDDKSPFQQFGKLAIKDRGTVELVPFENIEWIDAAGDYMCVHAGGQTHVMRCTMKELSEKLPGDLFARIHRSTLVNLSRIESVETLPKGEFKLFLQGNTLKVSRNYRKSILPLLS